MLSNIKTFLTNNKLGVTLAAVALAATILLMGVSGCTASDFVKVKVPTPVQKATGSAAKVSLTEAPDVMEMYVRAGDRFKENIDRGYEWLGFLNSLTTTAVEFGSSSIPGGAIGLSLLSLASGLFMKGPGTGKEKEKSYNKGLEEGRRLAESALAALKSDGS